MQQLNVSSPTVVRRRGRPVGSNSAATRQRILHAARTVISERGYQAATFQAISAAAGLSRPTLHYYFDTREAIYDALLAESSTVVSDCLAAVRRGDPLATQLGAIVTALQRVHAADRATVAFLVSARLEARRNPALAYLADDAVRTFLHTLVTEAAERGELARGVAVEPTVDMIQSLLWGVAWYAGFGSDAGAMEQITKQLNSLFQHGLLGDFAAS